MSPYDVDKDCVYACVCACGKGVYVHLCAHMQLYELWHEHTETKDSLPLSFSALSFESVSH